MERNSRRAARAAATAARSQPAADESVVEALCTLAGREPGSGCESAEGATGSLLSAAERAACQRLVALREELACSNQSSGAGRTADEIRRDIAALVARLGGGSEGPAEG